MASDDQPAQHFGLPPAVEADLPEPTGPLRGSTESPRVVLPGEFHVKDWNAWHWGRRNGSFAVMMPRQKDSLCTSGRVVVH